MKQVQADGNCFFRAVFLQIAGSEMHQLGIHNMVLNFEEMNRETYLMPSTNKPFEGHLELAVRINGLF